MNEEPEPVDVTALPGFALFAPEFRSMLTAVRTDDARAELLARTRDAVQVLAQLELLQFVYLPTDSDETEDDPEDDDVAWFSVDDVEVDDERDAVMLIGDVTHLFGGPITLEGISDDEAAVTE